MDLSRYNQWPYMETRTSTLLSTLLLLYIVSLPFTKVIHLPVISWKVQPPELIFLGIGIAFVLHFKKMGTLLKPGFLDKRILFFCLGVFIAGAIYFDLYNYLTIAGLFYLMVSTYVLSRVLSQQGEKLFAFVLKSFSLSGLIAAISGIFGVIAAGMGFSTFLINEYADYPYLGDVFRAKAFTPDPNLLANFLGMVLFLRLGKILNDRKITLRDIGLIIILFAAYLLTFSKFLLVFIAVLLLFSSQFFKNKLIRVGFWIGAFGVYVVFLFLVHFVVVDLEKEGGEIEYITENTVYEGSGFRIAESSYFILKRSCLISGWRRFPVGVGFGKHYQFSEVLKLEGVYPEHIPSYDPHSIYFGILSELGIVGPLLIAFLWGSIYFTVGKARKAIKDDGREDRFLLWAISAILTQAAMEAIALDLLHCRHYWAALAILGALLLKWKSREKTVEIGRPA